MIKGHEQVRAILEEADNRLRLIIAEAARAGNMTVVDIARLAVGHIREILASLVPGTTSPSQGSVALGKVGKKTTRSASRRKGHGKGGYPKFYVQNKMLYRLGWSKKRKQEYEHRVPRAAFERTVEAMRALTTTGQGPFTAEQITEMVNSSKRGTVPSYQVYVVIGFLRAEGLVRQVGREGYQIPGDLQGQALNVWQRLAATKP